MNFSTPAWLVALLLLLATLTGGCATKFEGAYTPALFPPAASAPASRAPGRLALVVRPQVQDLVHEGDQVPARGVRLPIGRIVEEATLGVFRDGLQGGVQRLVQVPAAGAGFAASVAIESVHVEHDSRVLWLVPIPVFPFVVGDSEVSARLAFELSLLDAQGRTVWTHSYDSGREVYKRPSFWSNELLPEGLLRMAHEAAWRLAQQALIDVREWLATERNKPREL